MTTPPGVPDDLAAHIFDRSAHGEPPPGVPRDIVDHENDQEAFSSRPAGVPEDLDLALVHDGPVTDAEEHSGTARHVREVPDPDLRDRDLRDQDLRDDGPRYERDVSDSGDVPRPGRHERGPDDDSSTHQ